MLNAAGICINDQFLDPAALDSLIECAQLRKARGDFSAARIGGEGGVQRREEIRGDFTCWLAEPLYPAEHHLLSELEQLRMRLNAETMLGLFELEMHYACYPPGAGYERHVDQPRGSARRRVSLVLYLNLGWESADGGALRLFDGEKFEDIEPSCGRLVCFLSAGQEHCVLPARRERLSLSGWFLTRD